MESVDGEEVQVSDHARVQLYAAALDRSWSETDLDHTLVVDKTGLAQERRSRQRQIPLLVIQPRHVEGACRYRLDDLQLNLTCERNSSDAGLAQQPQVVGRQDLAIGEQRLQEGSRRECQPQSIGMLFQDLDGHSITGELSHRRCRY